MMQKWEYKSITWNMIYEDEKMETWWGDDKNDQRKLTDRLNELGNEGWELVSTITASAGGTTVTMNYLLKRPVASAETEESKKVEKALQELLDFMRKEIKSEE